MLEETDNVIGLEVYTPEGIFLGQVDRVILDVPNKKVDGLFMETASPVLVDEGVSINIPYGWVQSVGDVVLLRYFPKRVSRNGRVEQ
ncbi:MAG: photosystem reaction center subunit H [Thermoplasmatales archaeon]|jgi:sporulation protein YlmC with PRC-barrel domain|nr:photosystem reaction center subunit H [Thermoplasmatales archaeon]